MHKGRSLPLHEEGWVPRKRKASTGPKEPSAPRTDASKWAIITPAGRKALQHMANHEYGFWTTSASVASGLQATCSAVSAGLESARVAGVPGLFRKRSCDVAKNGRAPWEWRLDAEGREWVWARLRENV